MHFFSDGSELDLSWVFLSQQLTLSSDIGIVSLAVKVPLSAVDGQNDGQWLFIVDVSTHTYSIHAREWASSDDVKD
jgi:hypothetical protein